MPSAPLQTLVIDTNVAVWAVTPVLSESGLDTLPRLLAWRRAGIRLVAPVMWLGESTSVIRKGVFLRRLDLESARHAIADLFELPIASEPLTADLCIDAIEIAGRLRQSKAYDSIYLALARKLDTELWTGDQRLVNAAKQAGIPNVRWIGET